MFELQITTNLAESPQYKTLMENKKKIFEFFDKAEKDLIQLKELIKSDNILSLLDNPLQTLHVFKREETLYNDLLVYLDMLQINTTQVFVTRYYLGESISQEEREKEKEIRLENVDVTLKNIKHAKRDYDKNVQLLLTREMIENEFKFESKIITHPILANYNIEL